VRLLVSLNNILIFYVACLGVHNVGVSVFWLAAKVSLKMIEHC
jgi:hypothetical protein